MSERNVELTRRFFVAYNAHDVEAFSACFDPSAEFQSVFAVVGGAVYHGHDDMPRYFRDVAEAWGDEIRAEPEAYFDLGERTLTFALFHGRGRHSGAQVAMPIALVVTWREDLIVYMKGYVHREEALSDLGVAEDELEPIDP
jgi:ketosteroid isomerase-like protein